MDEIVNKVAQSGLINLDMKDFRPKGERIVFDMKEVLWQGMALREKDFRAFVKEHDWLQYEEKFVAIDCSVDAIIPNWAYMLMAVSLEGIAKHVSVGPEEKLEEEIFQIEIEQFDAKQYQDERIILKGCSDHFVPRSAYFQLAEKLKPVVKSLMFGEPCSTVPVYKKPRK
ncbi:MAG: DUF2480 family protein [Bacteroidota bacterium]